MYSLVVMSSGFVLLFIILLIKTKQNRVIIKKGIKGLKKNYGDRFCRSLWVVKFEQCYFAVLKNLDIKLIISDCILDIGIYVGSNFCRSYGNRHKFVMYFEDCKINFNKSGIFLESEKQKTIILKILVPNMQYFVSEKKKCISFIQDRYKINFYFDVKNFKVSLKKNVLFIELVCEKGGKVNFSNLWEELSQSEYDEFKLKNFGVIDVNEWEFLPNFKNENKLQNMYQQKLLNTKNKKVKFLEQKINILKLQSKMNIRNNDAINLDKLGLSKIVYLEKRKGKVILKDLLTNVFFTMVFNKKINFEIVNYWGENFLVFYGESECNFYFDKKFNDEILFFNFIQGDISQRLSNDFDLWNILDNLNRLILFGVDFDLWGLIGKYNFKYFSKDIFIKFANMVLSYIFVECRYDLLKRKEIKQLLFVGLKIAFYRDDLDSICYLKKFLPLIGDRKFYRKVLQRVENKKIMNINFEKYFSENLGIRLEGKRLFVKPSKELEINITLMLKGVFITLKVSKNWKYMRVDGIIMVGIDYVDLLSEKFLIEFL